MSAALALLDDELVLDLDGRMVPAPLPGPVCIVVAHPKVPAWPETGARAERLELLDMLTKEFTTDAHYQPLDAPGSPIARLKHDSLPLLSAPPRVVAFVVDVDGPDHGRSASWDTELVERAKRLPGRPFGYWTRGGARFVWHLDEPAPIATWSAWYLDALTRITAVSGIVGDQACADWTRLYRAPHATRDGVVQSLGWVCGHPAAIGTWSTPEVPRGELLLAMRRVGFDNSKRTRLLGPKPDLRPPPPPEPEVPVEVKPGACVECGQAFKPREPHHKKCSACVLLARLVAPLASAGAGHRNPALLLATVGARKLLEDGTLDDGSRLSAMRAKRALVQAARACGLPDDEATDVIDRLGPGGAG